ncbi:MAG: hypothetical protein P8L24_04165 [Cytophagales bacterium]|nr:hypothetical protein [Cytophagales bacterium]
MKKCLLIFSCIFFGFVSYGQFGVGFLPSINWDNNSNGIFFGKAVEINYKYTDLNHIAIQPGHFTIQPGLSYGVVYNNVLDEPGVSKGNSNVIRLGVPIMYYLEENYEGLYVSLGPSFDIRLGYVYGNYSRVLPGIGFGFGYDCGKLQIGFDYGIGLPGRTKGRAAGLGVNYLIGNLF